MRTIFLHDSFWELYNKLAPPTQEKIDDILRILQSLPRPSENHVKHLTNSGGIYEIRAQDRTSQYRFLFFFTDGGNLMTGKEVLVCEGFVKKDNKDYKKPIKRVQEIKNDYNSPESGEIANNSEESGNSKEDEIPP